jgi:outer membrane protein TolC
MIRPTAFVLMAAVAGACALVHPVKLTPPPPPTAFALALEGTSSSYDGAFDPSRPRPDSAGRATEKAVWWSAFADPALDSTIQEALHNNYFLRDVRTLIYENYLDSSIPQGWWWPLQIGIQPTTPAALQHLVGTVAGTKPTALTYDVGNIDLTASYQLDVWGNLDARRQVGVNFAEQQRQSSETAAQNIAEQVAQLWFDILVARALKELTEGEVKYNEELFGLVKARFEQHLTPRLAVLQQEQQLLNLRAQVPLIAARIAMLNSQLTGLLGRLPSPHDDLVPADRRLPDLPPEPSLGTPSDLVENTSEMRFAKLRVTEIEHRINENLSSWLPVIELLGSAGVVGYGTGETFREGFVGVRLTWPVFDGGRRITEAQQLELTLKRRKWQYELAIKTAVGRVQDALLQENSQAESLRSLRGQIDLGRRVLEEARRLFEQGQSDYLPVLNALSSLAALERNGLQAQRLLLSYRVQLYRALGGNWSCDVTKLP